MSIERNASRLGAAMIMEAVGSRLLLCVVRMTKCRRRVMLILEYISTHGTPSGALFEWQPGSPRVASRCMSNPVHHAQVRVGSTRGERDPLQLGLSIPVTLLVLCQRSHTGLQDAAPPPVFACCNVYGVPYGEGIFQVRPK